LAVVIGGLGVLAGCGPGSTQTTVIRSGTVSWENTTGDPARYALEDGSLLVLSPKGKITQDINFGKGKRELTLDGEALLTIPKAEGDTFIIHTRNLNIVVLAAAKMHIDAYASSPGESADLLSGKLRVTKSYYSKTDNAAELLDGGDMIMINRDVDLMEKEKLNSVELSALQKRFER
jgi:ferric-dicitrate binding protein FerR (iron transport regulator)